MTTEKPTYSVTQTSEARTNLMNIELRSQTTVHYCQQSGNETGEIANTGS